MASHTCPACGAEIPAEQQTDEGGLTCPSCSKTVEVEIMVETPAEEPTDVLAAVDKVLAEGRLQEGPRAVLLLKMCKLLMIFKPAAFSRYFEQLTGVQTRLDSDHQEDLQLVKEGAEPSASGISSFAQEMIDLVKTGSEVIASDPERARQIFVACEQRLRGRWWWPFGKAPAWRELVDAWVELDRDEGLQRIGKVSRGVQREILARLNDAKPLTSEQWDMAQANSGWGGIVPTVIEMLDADRPTLHLSADLATKVGKKLRAEVDLTPIDDSQANQIKEQRETATKRYLKLVQTVVEQDADTARSLMEAVVLAITNSTRFSEKWPDRFSELRELINVWCQLEPIRDRASAFFRVEVPEFLRDFCLAHWHALIGALTDDVAGQWKALEAACTDVDASEAWFLVTLVRMDKGAEALAQAEASSRSGVLVPRVRRAWLSFDPSEAAEAISTDDLQGEVIAGFLHFRSMDERVEYLREITTKGTSRLPSELWRALDFSTISLFESGGDALWDGRDQVFPNIYFKTVEEGDQFRTYVKINGYGRWVYEQVDTYLMATLVAWDEKHPDEVGKVMAKMWETIKPEDNILMADALRNSVFERCQTVFPARPQSMDKLFIQWIKRTLVDGSKQQFAGDTTYTLSLRSIVLFLYCLIGAENVAKVSASRCDELIVLALKKYELDEDLVKAAARLYASDKPVGVAVDPPAKLHPASHTLAWQMGVVESWLPKILKGLVGG